MKLKDLEHDGNEDFNSFTVRKRVKEIEEKREEDEKEKEHELRIKQQEEWLSPENDLIWEGDRD